jgi:hypothetical protein
MEAGRAFAAAGNRLLEESSGNEPLELEQSEESAKRDGILSVQLRDRKPYG